MSNKTASEESVRLTEEAYVQTNWRVITLLILAAFTMGGVVLRWENKLATLETTSTAHTSQLATVQAAVTDSHERLAEIQVMQKEQSRLLNYLATGRSGRQPPLAATGNADGIPNN